jgi:EPS-associated MarR family transcriptional regulator
LNEPLLRFEADISPSASDHEQFELLRVLGTRPGAGQRELASSLGVSLGKANYVLRALIAKGFVKAENYRNSTNKLAYLYVLTPSGLAAKADLTKKFLERKVREYEELRLEIERLRRDAAESEHEVA